MKMFRVRVHRVYLQTVEIEAENEQHARQRVESGDGTEVDDLEFYYTLDSERWTVEPKPAQ